MIQSVCFRGEGIVCDTYDSVCVFQGRRHCLWYLWCSLCVSGEKALCVIPIEDILAVEGLQEESFKMKYVSPQQMSQVMSYYFKYINHASQGNSADWTVTFVAEQSALKEN